MVNNGCSYFNGQLKVDVIFLFFGVNNINNVCENSIIYKKDVEKYEFVNNLMDGENMWWKSLLEES